MVDRTVVMVAMAAMVAVAMVDMVAVVMAVMVEALDIMARKLIIKSSLAERFLTINSNFVYDKCKL